ncbi:hypothetical protein GGR56DRAFT_292630 [Xylariaceae sp. FL0804]|nr:hypothetical protein GGR56DRAFT_292630 [Xylariaceae sp. FL0804]
MGAGRYRYLLSVLATQGSALAHVRYMDLLPPIAANWQITSFTLSSTSSRLTSSSANPADRTGAHPPHPSTSSGFLSSLSTVFLPILALDNPTHLSPLDLRQSQIPTRLPPTLLPSSSPPLPSALSPPSLSGAAPRLQAQTYSLDVHAAIVTLVRRPHQSALRFSLGLILPWSTRYKQNTLSTCREDPRAASNGPPFLSVSLNVGLETQNLTTQVPASSPAAPVPILTSGSCLNIAAWQRRTTPQ